MAKKEHIIRTAFSDLQWGDVDFLMKHFRIDTAHELMRALVRDAAREVREDQLRYGKSQSVPRETKAERARRIMALDDAALTTYLMPLLVEEFNIGAEDKISIVTAEPSGMRMIHMVIKSTGMTDDVGLDYYFKRWEAEKRLPADVPESTKLSPSPGTSDIA